MTRDDADSPYRSHREPARPPRPARPARAQHPPKAAKNSESAGGGGGRGRKRGRGRKKAGPAKAAKPQRAHTSHPTTRAAQVSTREWLLKQHGPICAYCGGHFTPRTMTLDHVAPRRGQSAWDRRDNLVLSCGPCNALKRDQSPLAFLLARRTRAVNLVKYGAHLSEGLLELARSLIPGHTQRSAPKTTIDYSKWGPQSSTAATTDDDDSPYKV